MTRIVEVFRQITLSIWLGGGIFLAAIAAPAAFRAAPAPDIAAQVVGAMLDRWHWIAVVAPLVLLLAALRGTTRGAAILLGLGLLLGVSQILVDARIHAMRASSSVPMSSLARTDPVRRHFGMLHGISMSLLALQLCVAGTYAVVASARRMDFEESKAHDRS